MRPELFFAHRKKTIGALLAVLVLGMLLLVPAAVKAVDLERTVALTVTPGNAEQTAALESASLVLDIYLVAEAQSVAGYDTYEFTALEEFSDLGVENKELTNEQWRALAAEAAVRVFRGDIDPVVSAGEADTALELPEAGLYLVIARGSDLEEYVTEVNGAPATLAQNETQVFTFAPELVAVPGKAAVSGSINTANPGEWLYNVPITLKPDQDTRRSGIRIVKTLDVYEDSHPANFVFRIEATLNGATVKSDVVSMTFRSAGTDSVEIEDLPVGAQVVVTEDYPGANYRLVSAGTQTVTVQATEIAEASFENTYDETHKNGGIIVNHFEYDETDGWGWIKVEE